MKACNVIFREENSNQEIIIACELNDDGDLNFKLFFDPPVTPTTDLGTLSGQLASAFCKFLANG